MYKLFDSPTAVDVSRRDLLVKAITGAALGAGALLLPTLAAAQTNDPESVQVAEIHDLQAAFHLAKCNQDIDLMMSLYADDAELNFKGTNYVGKDAIRAFLLTTGSFTHLRISLVTSFKIQIETHGNEAYLYFECIDIGNYDTAPFVASVLYNAGIVRKIGGKWLYWRFIAGPAALSVDHYYYP
jgi:ketosteroid isomerase-like protein